eukprot:scaffold3370_cov359-Prasinococcus_capsulatus_cf.AAC.5
MPAWHRSPGVATFPREPWRRPGTGLGRRWALAWVGRLAWSAPLAAVCIIKINRQHLIVAVVRVVAPLLRRLQLVAAGKRPTGPARWREVEPREPGEGGGS